MAGLHLSFSEAVEGHLRSCRAAGYSDYTVSQYALTFRLFLERLGQDVPMRQISSEHIEEFMIWAQTDEVAPNGIAPRPARKRRPKTIKNYHIALCSLWTWAVKKGVVARHIAREVKLSKVNLEPIQPLSKEEMIRLLKSTQKSRPWKTDPFVTNDRPTHARDYMILCLLYETLVRAEEAVNIRVQDVEFQKPGGRIYIDLGKGKKSRYVPFGKRCAQAIQNYLLTRPGHKPGDYLIVNSERGRNRPMSRTNLGRLVKRLGERVGVDVHPHLLRTTGACHMLNNNVNPVELQHIMGHSDIKTTMRYVAAARLDLQRAIASSSPLDNL
jgi:site-specific recombinase XerD